MLYSRRCEYAIRALTHLAGRADGELVRLSEIAEARELPVPFARKICRNMVQEGFLRSARGPKGGYALARPASEISLLEIRDAVDGSADLRSCAVGLNPCTDETPCSLHHTWKPLREKVKRYLENTTLKDISRGRRTKRKRMEEAGNGGRADGAAGEAAEAAPSGGTDRG